MFEDLVAALTRLDRDVSDADRVDQLAALERAKAAFAAAQARITADFAESQQRVAAAWRERGREYADESDFDGWRAAREQARRASVEPSVDQESRRRPGAIGVADQVALARRESPSRGARHLATALALVRHLPRTLAALEAGAISEWRAEIVVRETAVLTTERQTALDAELFEGLGIEGVGHLGDRELVRRVRAIAYRLDAESVLARCRGAEAQRRVTIRPAPDTMSYVTAYLPVAEGVAVYAALTRDAGTARAEGDERPTGQLMADLLVERVTGQASAAAVPVEVQVVMTDRSLLAGDDAPAQVPRKGRFPPAGLESCWPATRRGRGYDASTRIRRTGRWWRWTRPGGCSTAGSAGSSWRATVSAALHGAMRRSGTSTTWSTTRPAARRAQRTARVCACAATTPSSCPGGGPDRSRRRRRSDGARIPSSSSRRPDIGMRPPHPLSFPACAQSRVSSSATSRLCCPRRDLLPLQQR